MSSSDISSLSSAESIDTDEDLISKPTKGTLDHYFKNGAAATKSASPPQKKKRPASPPHEYSLCDNPDIAFIVMFRSRFSAAFPKSLPHSGPQDIERGVGDPLPDEHVEKLLCALLGLVLNRKKDVERGHFQRALEEAIQTNAHQWPPQWEAKNPLHGGGNFNNMSPDQRLTLLKALVYWSLNSSDAIQAVLKESYKQQRHEDDLNQPLSVQPWGRDGDKRRYWLIEGQDDTNFRLYRESNPALKTNTWWSVASSIDDLQIVAAKLGEENSQAGKRLRERITNAIPRFEASEEKRKRRDYRLARKAQFTRPELGFSLYEGRTRGKRIKYNYSDEEDGESDEMSFRRSNRQSGVSTPAEPAGPTFTASGRQVKSRIGGAYGESILSGQRDPEQISISGAIDDMEDEDMDPAAARLRARRAADPKAASGKSKRKAHIEGYNALDEMDDESDALSSGGEWDGDEDEDDNANIDIDIDDHDDHDDADMSGSDSAADDDDELAANDAPSRQSLVVSLRYQKKHTPEPAKALTNGFATTPVSSTAAMSSSTVPAGSGKGPSRLAPDGPGSAGMAPQMVGGTACSTSGPQPS